MNIFKAIGAKWASIKQQIKDDQHTPPEPPPVKGEPYWVTRVHQQQEYDFRTGKRNDGREE